MYVSIVIIYYSNSYSYDCDWPAVLRSAEKSKQLIVIFFLLLLVLNLNASAEGVGHEKLIPFIVKKIKYQTSA